MPVHDTPSDRGARRGRFLRTRIAADLETARIAAGLSVRELGRRMHLSHHTVIRALRAERATLTLDFAARAAAVVGMELAASLHPAGAPVRDKGHLALLERLRRRLAPSLRWRLEVPVPIPGDPRSADAVIEGEAFEILVEAETHLYDVQALERAISGKQRDLGIGTTILLVADTRHNRQVISSLPELRARFPIPTRAALAALARGQTPGGDAIIVL